MKDVVIIGAGISGSSLARELSRYNLNILVLDKENDTAFGSTKANSGISHGGYDPEPNTLTAKYNVKGNRMMEEICSDLSVPFVKTGALIVGFDESDKVMLKTLYDRGIENGIPKEEQAIFTKEELEQKEPNISKNTVGAYWCGTTAVISSFELCVGMLENAVMNGVEVAFNAEVLKIEQIDEGYQITTNNKENPIIKTHFLVNAAGNHADKIHNMIAPEAYTIKSRRGEYYLLDKKHGKLTNAVIFQCPSDKGKGVLVGPTAHGNLIVGPNAYFVDNGDDVDTTPLGLKEVRELAVKSIPKIPFGDNLRNYSGNRAEPSTGDFIIGPVEGYKGFFEIAGIKSPGLTSAPAIAVDVAQMMAKQGLVLKEKSSFNPKRPVVHLDYLPLEERMRLIKLNPLYGRIVCRCEGVSEGEIIDALNRPMGGHTIEGIKKRTRVCAGTCQGGFCMPRILNIVARELNCDPSEIFQDKNGSHILVKRGEK